MQMILILIKENLIGYIRFKVIYKMKFM